MHPSLTPRSRDDAAFGQQSAEELVGVRAAGIKCLGIFVMVEANKCSLGGTPPSLPESSDDAAFGKQSAEEPVGMRAAGIKCLGTIVMVEVNKCSWEAPLHHSPSPEMTPPLGGCQQRNQWVMKWQLSLIKIESSKGMP